MLSYWKHTVLISLRLSKYCFILMLQSTDMIFLFYWLMRSFQNIICSTIQDISMICLFGDSYFAVHLCVLPTCSCLLSTGKDCFFIGEYCPECQSLIRIAVFRHEQKRRNPLCWYLNFALSMWSVQPTQMSVDVLEFHGFALYCTTERIQLKIKLISY